jgi:hypothetical protein
MNQMKYLDNILRNFKRNLWGTISALTPNSRHQDGHDKIYSCRPIPFWRYLILETFMNAVDIQYTELYMNKMSYFLMQLLHCPFSGYISFQAINLHSYLTPLLYHCFKLRL